MTTMQKQETTETRPERMARRTALVPPVDVLENREEFLIRADFPGVRQEDVDVQFEKNTLALVGRFSARGDDALDHEWTRTFVMPGGVDAAKIAAELKDGVLTVHLPKQESLKPRQIPVRTA
ncbi:MAG: Hsp20/alpha crystallin family protein [Deltaproteobacteria bacterium]|nr:Hsp20/alpha crystallin family protein [Deltaproteobacteria bacterium]